VAVYCKIKLEKPAAKNLASLRRRRKRMKERIADDAAIGEDPAQPENED
jgi:hypothetical protein